MSNIILNIIIAMSAKLMTEKFLSALIVHSLRALAERSQNKLDDKLVNDLAMALGVDQSQPPQQP